MAAVVGWIYVAIGLLAAALGVFVLVGVVLMPASGASPMAGVLGTWLVTALLGGGLSSLAVGTVILLLRDIRNLLRAAFGDTAYVGADEPAPEPVRAAQAGGEYRQEPRL